MGKSFAISSDKLANSLKNTDGEIISPRKYSYHALKKHNMLQINLVYMF